MRSVTSIISSTLGVEKEQVEVDLEAGRARFEAPDPGVLEAVLAKLQEQGFAAETL
ncbi:MAG: hypothetical protein H0U74_10480 [Bradymonadaceae bacterium]|nr:hypothetical protein [Lujinxingiaceae bacterium]